jgi:hypothetical protein
VEETPNLSPFEFLCNVFDCNSQVKFEISYYSFMVPELCPLINFNNGIFVVFMLLGIIKRIITKFELDLCYVV